MTEIVNCNSEENPPASFLPVAVQAEAGAQIRWQIPVTDAARAAQVKMQAFIQPVAANRISSPFYAGAHALFKLTLDDRQAMIYVNGDIRLKFEADGCYYKNSQVADELISRQMNDDDYRLLVERGFSADENWFEIVPLLPNETELEVLPDIEGDIPDAIGSALTCLLDDEFWQTELAGYAPQPEDEVLIECGNCNEDFPEGGGYKYDLFCSSHCYLRHYGEQCVGDCPACAAAPLENPSAAAVPAVETGGSEWYPLIF